MRPPPPPVFSRRSFLFFILLGPAGLLTIAAIVAALQYRQFQAMVSPAPAVEEFAWAAGDRLRLGSLPVSLGAFAAGEGPDSLWLSPADLTLLANAAPAPRRQGIRFRISAGESLLVVESSQRVDALGGRLAWIFKRIAPVEDGWLNARMEGRPQWKSGGLDFFPERGFLNGTRVSRTALTKRGGLSPKDFLDPRYEPEYSAFLRALGGVEYRDGEVVLTRIEN